MGDEARRGGMLPLWQVRKKGRVGDDGLWRSEGGVSISSLGGFAFSPDGGGRSPLEREGASVEEAWGKAAGEGNQKHLENNS